MRSRNLIGAACVTVALTIAAVGLSTTAALAEGTGDPVITAPTQGKSVASGWNGPIRVDFSNAPADRYDAELWCNNNSPDSYHTFGYRAAGDDIQSWVLSNGITGPKSKCTLDIYAESSYQESQITFTVAAPPLPALTLDNVSISPTTFYPLVRDGFKDGTRMSYRVNRSANVTARVYNATGHVVRRAPLGTEMAGQHSWAWNGRKNDGTKVNAGKFRIQISAEADRTRSASRWATVATGWRYKSASKYRGGYDTSSTSHSSSCYVDFYYYLGETDLDCWGGSYAQATYHFNIPANAYNLDWSVSGYRGCCSNGTTSKWGSRTSSTSYGVSVRVTNWHAYSITDVRVSYSYKVRI